MAERMSKGAGLLRKFLERNGITKIAAAAALGVSDPTVHDWATGSKRPRTHHRETIQVWTSGAVPADSWTFPEERAAATGVVPFKSKSDAA